MYITFDYQGNQFDTLTDLPYGTKEIDKDIYYNSYSKLFYIYTLGDAKAYRYLYMSMRVKSIDGVNFNWTDKGALSSARGNTTLNILYNEYRIISKINFLFVKFDSSGNLLKYSRYPGNMQ